MDVYRLQAQPRGVCLIIDCVGNDGGEHLHVQSAAVLGHAWAEFNLAMFCFI